MKEEKGTRDHSPQVSGIGVNKTIHVPHYAIPLAAVTHIAIQALCSPG